MRVVLLLVFVFASVASAGFVPAPAPVGALDSCFGFDPVINAGKQWVPVVNETLKTTWGTVTPPKPSQQGALLSQNDNFRNHGPSHDWDSFLKLDSAYVALTNAGDAEQRLGRILEVEWESLLHPDFVKPPEGDHQWVMGRWIYGCFHGKRTEIHPPVATAIVRDEPGVLPGSSSTLPAKTVRFFASGQGGYRTTSINGRTFSFEVPLPARPASTAKPAFRAFRPVDTSLGLFDFLAPKITPLPNATSPTKLLVSFSTVGRTSTRPIAAQIVAGWLHTPSASKVRKLRVIFDKLTVKDDEDTFSCGEWRLVVGANGHRYTIPQDRLSDVGSSNLPFVDCDDGTQVPIGRSVDFNVLTTGKLNIRATGFECDVSCGEFPGGIETDDQLSALMLPPLTAATNFGVGRTIVARTPNYDLTFRVVDRAPTVRSGAADRSRAAEKDGARDGKKHGAKDHQKKGAKDHKKKGGKDHPKRGARDQKRSGASADNKQGTRDAIRPQDGDVWHIDAPRVFIPIEKYEGQRRALSED